MLSQHIIVLPIGSHFVKNPSFLKIRRYVYLWSKYTADSIAAFEGVHLTVEILRAEAS